MVGVPQGQEERAGKLRDEIRAGLIRVNAAIDAKYGSRGLKSFRTFINKSQIQTCSVLHFKSFNCFPSLTKMSFSPPALETH